MSAPEREPDEKLGKRLAARARALNRHPRLVALARSQRHQAMGEERSPSAFGGAGRGLLGELGVAGLQAWQRVAESQARGRGEADVTILFTDLAGFSDWALAAGDGAAVSLVDQLAEATEPPIRRRRGQIVKRLGDGLMAAFGDGEDALLAAVELNQRVAAIAVEGYEPRLRTGLHLGRPRKLRGDYFGVDVNVAARLMQAAKPGEILASETALAALPAIEGVRLERRRFRAKGAPRDLAVYRVSPADPD